MTASVIYLHHALTPHKRRIEHVSPRSIRSLSPDWKRPHIAMLNGKAVLRADWGRTLHHGETLAFIDVQAIPQGGGDGGSNPLQAILMLAVLAFAPMAGTWIAGQMGATLATGSFALSMVETISVMAGMMLVNALIPPPKLTTPQQAAALAAPSPTYNLQAQGNTARLEAAIPEHFGRLPAFPDYAAQPYQEYAGNEQYLYQLLCLGRGEYDIEAIRIEDTPVESFDDITYEVVPPYQAVTLFPANVVSAPEVSGQDLRCSAATYERTGTTVTVTWPGHGLTTSNVLSMNFTSGGALNGYYLVLTPTTDTFTLTTVASGTIAAGNTCIASVTLGPFNASAPETVCNYIGFDLVMPRGLYYATDTGALAQVSVTVAIQAAPINDAGGSIGAWVTIGTETISAATTTPQRHSFRYNVTQGRYRIRAFRVDVEQFDSRYGHDVAWAGLRAYLPDTRTFGDVTLIAMRMRASNNLSMQASRKVNVIATRKLPIWNGSTWSANTATASIAWPIAYACKQIGLTDSQIDLATLLALDATWTARGDEFNGRFDNFMSFWETISKIAVAGRAKPFMQAGVVRFVRDQASTIPVQLYSTRNIQRGSFSVDYLMPTADTADAIDVGYFDANAWAPRRVRAMLPDSSAARPAKIELFGVTSRDQAYREGVYQAASNRYRRKLIRFSTEMEGFIPSFGDLIAVQHDMPAWGQGGEITAWNEATRTATLSEIPDWGVGTHYIALRRRDGSVDGPYAIIRGGAERDVILASVPDFPVYVGGNEERTHYALGAAEAFRQPARVLSIRPRGLHSVEIGCINEDASVHTAELGMIAPAIQYSLLAGYTNAPVIEGLTVRSSPSDPLKMLLSWKASAWAEYYLIEQSSDGANWTRTGETGTSNYAATALYGSATLIRVAAVGIAKGPWVQVAYGDGADYAWNAIDTTLAWNADDTTLAWRY